MGITFRLSLMLALAWGATGCGRQPTFSIPACSAKDTHCVCLLAGWQHCGEVCVNLSYDSDNCGWCGHSCGSGRCVAGMCQSNCQSLVDCGGHCKYDGDPYHCGGGCGVVCDGRCVGASCVALTAQPVPCPAGQTRCGDNCVILSISPFNCGGCGITCPRWAPRCNLGSCK